MKMIGILSVFVGFLMVMTGGSMLDSVSLSVPFTICVFGIFLLGFGTSVISKNEK